MQEEKSLSHPMYPRCDINEADAVAWVAFDSKSDLEIYPCKFPKLQDDQVRVKILYSSICHSDISTIRGYWGNNTYPCCAGHEIVGEVAIVGKDVTSLKTGDVVGVSPIRWCCMKCEACLIGRTNICKQQVFLYGPDHFGGFCTHVQTNHQWVWPIPQGIKLESAPPLLCAGSTVFASLFRYGKAGDRCAVIGVGGLGHLAIQYANKMGMKVTAFTTKPERKKEMQQFGATSISHSMDKEVLKSEEGNFDLVLNTLFVEDSEIYTAHQRLTAPGGVYLILGIPSIQCKFPIDYDYLSKNQINVTGTLASSIDVGRETLRFSAEHNIEPMCEYFCFQDFNKALHRAEKEGPKFRCVINVTDWAKKNGFDK